jgi:hypothetical protein
LATAGTADRAERNPDRRGSAEGTLRDQEIMHESLESEAKALVLYRELLKCVEGRSVILEEYARNMVYAEELHASEVDKMLRRPGEVAAVRPAQQSAA